MKKIKIFASLLVAVSCLIIVPTIFYTIEANPKKMLLAPNCCSASCKNGSCSVGGQYSNCNCGCSNGFPSCQTANSISANSNQISNIDDMISLLEGFNSSAGENAAAVSNNIKALFINNDYLLENPDGNMATYYNYLNQLDEIVRVDFTDSERLQLEEWIGEE